MRSDNENRGKIDVRDESGVSPRGSNFHPRDRWRPIGMLFCFDFQKAPIIDGKKNVSSDSRVNAPFCVFL